MAPEERHQALALEHAARQVKVHEGQHVAHLELPCPGFEALELAAGCAAATSAPIDVPQTMSEPDALAPGF